jgi:hypothetical protein
MLKQGLPRQQLGSTAITATLLVTCLSSACGGSSTNVKPDTRTRHNEPHITIHQDASQNDPIIGWAVENGNPSKNTFRAMVRFLELSVLGTADHPSRCAIIIEKLVSHEPDEDPMSDDPTDLDFDIGSPQPTAERSYTIPCSEHEKSTQIAWPDGSIVLSGHIAEPSSSEDSDNESASENHWQFVIDGVVQAPRITKFDPPDSFAWVTSPPTAAPSPPKPVPAACMKSGVDLATLSEFTPTPAQLAVYRNSYRSEVVRGIRSALDKYVEGTADEETRDSIEPYGPKFGRDRFVLFSADKSIAGGSFVRLEFRHSMDSIYQVWLYRLGGAEPILRDVSKVPCSADQIRALNRMYKRFWLLPYDG